MASPLSAVDVGLLRTVPAALILLPVTLRLGLLPGGARVQDGVLIGLVGGGLFILCLALGLTRAPVADGGIFTPSMLPVFVALLSLLFLGERVRGLRMLGLALIAAGALLVGGAEALLSGQPKVWHGHLLFLVASLSWATYTVRFRQSGLSAVNGTAILVTWPAIVFGIAAIGGGSNLMAAPPGFLVLQLAQGVAAGLIANFTFFYAIERLGTPIAAASAALVPILAAIGGWVFLAEPISAAKFLGILVTVTGVVLASGILAQRQSHL